MSLVFKHRASTKRFMNVERFGFLPALVVRGRLLAALCALVACGALGSACDSSGDDGAATEDDGDKGGKDADDAKRPDDADEANSDEAGDVDADADGGDGDGTDDDETDDATADPETDDGETDETTADPDTDDATNDEGAGGTNATSNEDEGSSSKPNTDEEPTTPTANVMIDCEELAYEVTCDDPRSAQGYYACSDYFGDNPGVRDLCGTDPNVEVRDSPACGAYDFPVGSCIYYSDALPDRCYITHVGAETADLVEAGQAFWEIACAGTWVAPD